MRARGWWLPWLLIAPVPGHADPSALWNIVNGKCVPHQQVSGDPAPCALVEPGKGYAILKDINGIAQYLLIPTARIGGIEDAAILADGQANFWDAAWNARSFVESRLQIPLPRSDVSLAINSTFGRTQNQFHIHIDCVRRDVRDILAANLDKITRIWAPFPVPLAGHVYRGVRIEQPTLAGVDPFRLLADSDPHVEMGRHTLVLIGATFPDAGEGFVLLDDQVDLSAGDLASGEQLQDHTCAIAGK